MASRSASIGSPACCSASLGMTSAKIFVGWIVAVILSSRLTVAVSDFPALILFGDSTLDVGTNNYIPTLVKSDFLPYGRDLNGRFPAGSGRFSNGLMVPDYVADVLGLPSPLPYLDPDATGDKLLTGINFASAGSGWLDSTNAIYSVRSIKQQVEDFKEYIGQLTELVGPNKTHDIICNALYVVSSGTNDFVNNYYLVPIESSSFTVEEWQGQILSTASVIFQEIYSLGARNILVASEPAFGCLPAAITFHGGGSNDCIDYMNDAAVSTNVAIQEMLQSYGNDPHFSGVQFLYVDIYSGILNAFENPAASGFDQVRFACCGTGTFEVAILCNSESLGTCSDASKFLFFDSFHPTQTFYSSLSQTIIQDIMARY